MLTRTQRYAAKAFELVESLKQQDKSYRDKYKSMAEKLPALIRSAGLAQALAFVEAKSVSEKAWGDLLNHLAQTVEYDNRETGLPAASRSSRCALSEYLRLTNETLEALLWYKRFAQSLLGKE